MGTIRHATLTSELSGAKVGASEWDEAHDIDLEISDIDGLQDALDAAGGDPAIADVTGLQAALDAKLAASSYTAADVLAKLLTVDGSGSGLDADTLDGQSSAAFAAAGHNHDAAYQPLDADLTAIAALTTTAFGRAVLELANAGALRTTAGLGTIATLDETTTAQYRANTADKALSTDQVWAAADYVALTDAATVAVDMSAGFNFSLTIGGNRTLGAPSNTKNGQTGAIVITQDGTGSRTLGYHANWKFAGGTDPTLSTAAGAVDVLFYQVISSTSIVGNLVKAIA